MSDATFTLNDKEYKIADLTDDQKKLLAEANMAKAGTAEYEYKYTVMRNRYEVLVNALAKELDGGTEAEA